MNYKKQILLFGAASLLGVILGITFLCQPDAQMVCQSNFGEWVIATYLILAIIFLFFIPLFFLKEGVYLAWRKFALIYLPIVAVLILLSPSSGGSGFNPGVGFDSESLTFFFSGLFVFISIILIITKSFSLRGK